MARTDSAKARMARWRRELDASEKIFKDWTKDYATDKLEAFVVQSRQWADNAKKLDPYLCNLLLPSLDARMPALLFDTPHVIVTAQSPKTDDGIPLPPPQPPMDPLMSLLGGGQPQPIPPPPPPQSTTPQGKAMLRQDLVNTIIQDKRSNFSYDTGLALRESFFRFGMVEVYYTAEIQEFDDMAAEYDGAAQAEPAEPSTPEIENAATPPGPKLNESGQPSTDNTVQKTSPTQPSPEEFEGPAPELVTTEAPQSDSLSMKLPKRIPRPGTERIKFRRIPARTVRFSQRSTNDINRCDWVAYYDWKYVDDIKANPNYKKTSGLKARYSASEQVLGTQEGDADKVDAPSDGMMKVWKLWSIRERKQYIWVDGEDSFLVDGKKYKTLPLSGLKFIEVLDEWLPVPVAFNWTGPQIEYNETRDGQRTHRKRALRKYVYHEGIDDEEIAKLSSPEDMAFAKIPTSIPLIEAIQPVNPASMDPISVQQIQMTRNEVFEATRVGGEARQVATSNTAKQASIIAISKQVQDSKDRTTVKDWLVDICTIALKLAEENVTFGYLIKTNVDTKGPGAQQEIQRIGDTWRIIQMDDLDNNLEYEVKIDIESLAPMNSTMMAQQWSQLLALLSNPAILMIFSRSESIARRVLSNMGIRDEADIQEVMTVARSMVPPPGVGAPASPQAGSIAAPQGGDQGADLAALLGGGLK